MGVVGDCGQGGWSGSGPGLGGAGTSLGWGGLPVSTPRGKGTGVSARWCTCGFCCHWLGALVCAGSLLVAACRGLGSWALLGLFLGSDVCSGIDVCQLGLWAHQCSSLGFPGKTLYTQVRSHSDPQVFRFRC
ncbi:hypothetical protein XENOCAPTIV_019398 [Xenoophorus captivus]|uniref:Uncharacterized protein n=1 Tax=Xenoophorus captivus TaxID=1517983 RepID=A0ABV0SAU1_9TELE